MFNQGDIVLINIPFSDLRSSKKRPALIVSKDEYNRKQEDVIIAAITSNLKVKDYTVEFDNNDLKSGAVLKKSCVRADKLYTLNKLLIIERFAVVSDEIFQKTIEMIESVTAHEKSKDDV